MDLQRVPADRHQHQLLIVAGRDRRGPCGPGGARLATSVHRARLRRALVVLAASVVPVMLSGSPAVAAIAGSTSATTQTIGSAEWSSVASASAAGPYPTGALSLAFGSRATQEIWFYVDNSGTVSLTGATYSLSASGLSKNASVTVYACVAGNWTQATSTCTGTITAVVSSTGPTVTATVSSSALFAPNPGESLLLVGYVTNLNATPAATFGVSVSRSTEVRSGAVSNS